MALVIWSFFTSSHALSKELVVLSYCLQNHLMRALFANDTYYEIIELEKSKDGLSGF